MKDYLFLYRSDYNKLAQRTPAEAEAMIKKWMDWMGNIAAQNKLTSRGHRLQNTGKVLKNDVVTNGPYMEIKESIGGYSLVKAASYEDAVELAKSCPILKNGGQVEVREINPM